MDTEWSSRNGAYIVAKLSLPFFIGLSSIFFPIRASSADRPKSNAAIRLAKLENQFQSATDSWYKKMEAARTDKERAPLWKIFPPKLYSAQYRALVREYPSDPSTAKSAAWLVKNGDLQEDRQQSLRILLKYHSRSNELDSLIHTLEDDNSTEAIQLLRSYISSRKDATKVLKAKLTLAKQLTGKSNAEAARLFKEVESGGGKDIPEYKNAPRTLAEAATAALFEMNSLSIGKKFPDIEGNDVFGKKFKLSDYAGKVIMLDFFGFW